MSYTEFATTRILVEAATPSDELSSAEQIHGFDLTPEEVFKAVLLFHSAPCGTRRNVQLIDWKNSSTEDIVK